VSDKLQQMSITDLCVSVCRRSQFSFSTVRRHLKRTGLGTSIKVLRSVKLMGTALLLSRLATSLMADCGLKLSGWRRRRMAAAPGTKPIGRPHNKIIFGYN